MFFFINLLGFLIGSFIFCKAEVTYTPSSVRGWPNLIETCDHFILSPGDLILDHETDRNTPPYRLRIPLDFIKSDRLNTDGLEKIKISGSAQFTVQQLQVLLTKIQTYKVCPCDVYIVDLREEKHGFINQNAVSVHTGPVGQEIMSAQEVLKHEKIFFEGLSKGKTVPIYIVEKLKQDIPKQKKPILTLIQQALTEQEICKNLSINYVRIPVMDHFKPREEAIESFLNFFEKLPPQAWVHFHCRGGRGRTTTFMVFYDILKNPHLTLNVILKRHEIMGGTVLNKENDDQSQQREWGGMAVRERFLLVQRFYEYVHDIQNGYGKNRWGIWINRYHPQDTAHDSLGIQHESIFMGD